MYFQIENTPEHVKSARKKESAKHKVVPIEETPRLIIAPFSRPPQVVFENVVIGSTAERNLEVYNPTQHGQRITLGKALPPGLEVHLPGEWLELEPETCYTLTMAWTPLQPTALRETLRFTNENRGRFDIIVVLKSAMIAQKKTNQPKGFKTSPGKSKKKSNRKSPVAIYKKKYDIVYNTATKIKQTTQIQTQTSEIQTQTYQIFRRNKENLPSNYLDQNVDTCPFDSQSTINFDTSEIFSNMKTANNNYDNILQETYEKYDNTATTYTDTYVTNVLQPVNRPTDCTGLDAFDNLTFTPLKNVDQRNEKLEVGPKIVLSMNSESSFDDSLDKQYGNKENEPHSMICIGSAQPGNKWLAINQLGHVTHNIETPSLTNKKIPNTSSPKEMTSPNFSIYTEFSRISDLSFVPPRFSTEKKVIPKPLNDTHDMLDDILNSKMHSDTYTKESPNSIYPSLENNPLQGYAESRPQSLTQQKVCRQSLFKEFQLKNPEYQKEQLVRNRPYFETNAWQNELRVDIKSPTRSLTPPLQSIPEESSGHFSETHILDKTDKQNTFTINRTFDKMERPSLCNRRESWSKKSVRAEPELWKVPVSCAKRSSKQGKMKRDSNSTRVSNVTFDSNKSLNQNASYNQIGNVYSQSLTVDPFMSSTYFYDEEAVEKFEYEFKRWLNYILTPPVDLESNIEQKIDVGKAWIENRNRDIPLAPTKEQVCSDYHNSHRLVSLRRAARALLMSPEIATVIQKLNLQIDKKLIAVRNDRNLHLDVGLQKTIMEIILSYNPLWLRIGLEAIYGLVIPLKSNSDIEGLTTFIIQRMFKNPFLKNKHSKSNAPNMLLPAYMEAIKKFTLKKFYMLVFFLDQAKQRKLIPHDPCLFCRNALCKESREVVIRFTRELIAGIGDITKHLRPLGYVVSVKQTYLDEYKYAVHNIAVDLRDGVRLAKVMEIILMKNNLMNQMRAPAISRLQKIHNVQVALNALKEANFVIVGDISAQDVADGHREKTLSLLWQIIHVFRAPLFENAANVIQTWWKKKYEVIIAKRKEEEEKLAKVNNAASVIQCWWRRIQYNRYVEAKMQRVIAATVAIQKYCRMWLCRSLLMKQKTSAIKIQRWYRSVRLMREAKQKLEQLKHERELIRNKAATKIQVYFRRWICIRQYEMTVKKIILLQSIMRCYILRKRFLYLKETAVKVQRRYRGKLAMKKDMKHFARARDCAVKIQSYYRMLLQRRRFKMMKKAVRCVQEKYIALSKMRQEKERFLKIRSSVILIQSLFRGKRSRQEYLHCRQCIVKLQRRFRANREMKKQRKYYLLTKAAAMVVQTRFRALLKMRQQKQAFEKLKSSALTIQKYFRSYLIAKAQRKQYLILKVATYVIQTRYRALLQMRKARAEYITLKRAAVHLQKRYRAQKLMQRCQDQYGTLRKACITIQTRYRAKLLMKTCRTEFLKLKNATVIIQRAYKALYFGRKQRLDFLIKKNAALDIQRWYRSCKKTRKCKKEYQGAKQSCVLIQRTFRAYLAGRKQRHEYLRIRTATICIQKYYRCYVEMKMVRQQYVQLKTATVKIQRKIRANIEGKKQREFYLRVRNAVMMIQDYYRRYKITQRTKKTYLHIRKSILSIQRYYRNVLIMREQRARYLKLKNAAIVVQKHFRALVAMRTERTRYLHVRSAVVKIQTRLRAQIKMKKERCNYLKFLQATKTIQQHYKARLLCRNQRKKYLQIRQAVVNIQTRYRSLMYMRSVRQKYNRLKNAAIVLQRRYRARVAMLEHRQRYTTILHACRTIQTTYKAYVEGKKQREIYLAQKSAAILIQQRYRQLRETRITRTFYLIERNAAIKIQQWYRSLRIRNQCRHGYLHLRKCVITIQSTFRMYIHRKRYLNIKNATVLIQRYYRSYKLMETCRIEYQRTRSSIIKLQSHFRAHIQRKKYLKLQETALILQSVYRLKQLRKADQIRRQNAALCIQKNFRRYMAMSRYIAFRDKVILVQRTWRSVLLTRLLRCEFRQTRRLVVRLQARARGLLARRDFRRKRAELEAAREQNKKHRAAAKIQALFRGNRVRAARGGAAAGRAAALRRRWRAGALASTQESLKERNDEAMEVLSSMYDIETVIRAFRSLELLTEVFPMMYNENASGIVQRVYYYMSVMNRSISSVEVLKSAAAVLVNLARYRVTGPNIYNREHIAAVLKFMLRFGNSETPLFCILATYVWLFSKYEATKQDLTDFLHVPENHKMLLTIKSNIDRMKRMVERSVRNRPSITPQTNKFVSHAKDLNSSVVLPALEPDYGIKRADKPHYFEDAFQAINCLFQTYNL